MNTKTKVKWLSVLVLICLLLIGPLAHYIWLLKSKNDATQIHLNSNLHALQDPFFSPRSNKIDPLNDHWGASGNFLALQKRMDELMSEMMRGESILSNPSFGHTRSSARVSMNESPEEYKVTVTVAQGEEVELNTELTDGILKISGKVKISSADSITGFMARSQSISQFSQSMVLSEAIDESAMKTEQNDNEIVIRIPKKIS